METLSYFFLLLALMFTFAVLIGLVKPLLVGWFWAVCNRKKVVSRYGSAAFVCWALYMLLKTL